MQRKPVLIGSSWMCLRKRMAPALALFSLAVIPVRGDRIVSSLSNNVQAISFASGFWAASPFTNGFQDFTLTNVTLSLGQGGQNASQASVRLFADSSGSPGVPILDLGVQEITGLQPQLWSFGAVSGVHLNPFTAYWVGVGNVSPTEGLNVNLVIGAPFNFVGVPGAVMSFSGASGTGSGGNPPTTWDPPGAGAALPFEADGIPGGIPEPSALALLLVGGLGLVTRLGRCR